MTSISLSHLFIHILKRLINRPRPYQLLSDIENLIIPFESYSFPSGHTTCSFSIATILLFYFPAFRILFIFLATIIGCSRIYLGVHYPSDVIAGAIIGIIFSFLVHFAFPNLIFNF